MRGKGIRFINFIIMLDGDDYGYPSEIAALVFLV